MILYSSIKLMLINTKGTLPVTTNKDFTLGECHCEMALG